MPGDVVEVRNTGGPPLQLWQNGDWTVPWDQWRRAARCRLSAVTIVWNTKSTEMQQLSLDGRCPAGTEAEGVEFESSAGMSHATT